MFHLISFSPHFTDHVSFLFPSVHSPFHSFHLHSPSRSYLPYLVALILHGHSTLFVSFTYQPIPSLEINDVRVSLDKFLILGKS